MKVKCNAKGRIVKNTPLQGQKYVWRITYFTQLGTFLAGRIEKERLVGTEKGQTGVMTEMGRIWLIQWERIRDGGIYEIPDMQMN